MPTMYRVHDKPSEEKIQNLIYIYNEAENTFKNGSINSSYLGYTLNKMNGNTLALNGEDYNKTIKQENLIGFDEIVFQKILCLKYSTKLKNWIT